jgi:WD40 repeat protein/serine/threonine protein kinase
MRDAAAWRIGRVVAGLYRVDEVLGRGGMGLVHRVHHLGWDVDLAVKSPRPEWFTRADALQRFAAEAQIWVSLGLHRHVCGCHYVRVIDGVPRVFAEYVEGGTLRRWIDDGRLYRGGPPEVIARVLDVAIQIAWGLQYAHERGVVHQDVKPGNVLLGVDGAARITDFGLARARAVFGRPADPEVSALVTVAGMTRAYASPEQIAGQPVGRRSDVFSFAASVLELFTGGVSWLAGPAARAALDDHLQRPPEDPWLPRMPSRLAELLRRCLHDDPARRPADLSEIAAVLAASYRETLGGKHPRMAPPRVELGPDELNNRGVSLLNLGRPDEAMAAFSAALAMDPHHAHSVYNAGVVRWRAGALADDVLVGRLEAARALGDDRGRAAYPLALVHLERGDVAAAAPLLDEVAQRDPQHPEAARLARLAREGGSAEAWTVGPRAEAGHAVDRVNAVSFTADGQYVITASTSSRAEFWHVRTGRCVWMVAEDERHRDQYPWAHAAAISPDRRWAVFEHGSGAIDLRDLTGASAPVLVVPARENRTYSPLTVSFSGDGRRLITASGPAGIRLWEVPSGRTVAAAPDFAVLLRLALRRPREGPGGRIPVVVRLRGGGWTRRRRTVARRVLRHPVRHSTERGRRWPFAAWLDPNGRRALVVAGTDVWLWYIAERRLRLLIDHPTSRHALTVAGFDADGRRVLIGGTSGDILVLDVRTGRRLITLRGHTHDVTSACFSSDGRRALSGGRHGDLRLWDLETGQCLRTFPGHAREVASVCFSPDGHSAVTGGGDGTARIWHLASLGFRASALLCLPRTDVAITDADTAVSVLLHKAEHAMERGWVGDAVAALGAARAVPGHQRTAPLVQAWRRAARISTRMGLRAAWPVWVGDESCYASAIGFGPDGSGVVVVNSRAEVSVWDPERQVRTARFDLGGRSLADRQRLIANGKEYVPVAVTDNGYAVVARGRTADLYELHDQPAGRLMRTLDEVPGVGAINRLYVGSGRRHVLAVDVGRAVVGWDLATGACVGALPGPLRSTYAMCLSPDGRMVLTTELHAVHLWDLSTGERWWSDTPIRYGIVTSVRFSPDGRTFLVARHGDFDEPPITDIFSMPGRRSAPTRRLRLAGHREGASAACFSSDGRYLLTGGPDRSVRLWDLRDGRCLWTTSMRGHSVLDVRFSADGTYALASSGPQPRAFALDWDLVPREPARHGGRAMTRPDRPRTCPPR